MSEKDTVAAERLPDDTVVHIMPDGSRLPIQDEIDWMRLKNMTDAEVEAVALSDPGNLPMTDEELKQFQRVPNPKQKSSSLPSS